MYSNELLLLTCTCLHLLCYVHMGPFSGQLSSIHVICLQSTGVDYSCGDGMMERKCVCVCVRAMLGKTFFVIFNIAMEKPWFL